MILVGYVRKRFWISASVDMGLFVIACPILFYFV